MIDFDAIILPTFINRVNLQFNKNNFILIAIKK